MHIRFLRHATFMVTLGRLRLLVDPMLSPAGAMEPPPNTPNPRKVPLVDLPLDDEQLKQLLAQVDAVLVTHNHRDHWDARAVELLPKTLPVLCQPQDEAAIRQAGFAEVLPVDAMLSWRGLQLARTGGQHGTGELGRKLGPVSGFVLSCPGEPSFYIAGDTVWCEEVEQALRLHQPDVTLVNAGAAQFLKGGPITMTAEDVCRVCRALPQTKVIAVHLETWNHCLLTRVELSEALRREGLAHRVLIPADGELLEL